MSRLFGTVFLFISLSAWSQDLIRFSGVVLDTEDLQPVFGTTILNQSRGGGAVSDSLGFFTVNAMPGDTLLFSDIRYTQTQFVIPEVLKDPEYGVIQLLVQKELLLEEVEVFSFPTEDDFKYAFMQITPDPSLEMKALASKRNLMNTIKNAYEEERYYYENWSDRRLYELSGQIPPNHLLDPIRWTNFIRDHRNKLNK